MRVNTSGSSPQPEQSAQRKIADALAMPERKDITLAVT